MDTTTERLNDQLEVADDLIELGEVSRDTKGFFLGLFSDAGGGRRLIPA